MFRSSSPTYYETLQISHSASAEIIEAVYRRLARTYHPDLNRENDTTAQMQAINIAYSVLIDPVQRQAYDLSLNVQTSSVHPTKKRNFLSKWSEMPWPTRISFICIVLSIMSIIGIIQNLVRQQPLASGSALIDTTTWVSQLEQLVTMQGEPASATVSTLDGVVVIGAPPEATADLTGVEPTTARVTVAQATIAESDTGYVQAENKINEPGESNLAHSATLKPSPESERSTTVVADSPDVRAHSTSEVTVQPSTLEVAPKVDSKPPPATNSSVDSSSKSLNNSEGAIADSSEVQRSGLGQKSIEPINYSVRQIKPFPGSEVGGIQSFEWIVVGNQASDRFVELILWKSGENPIIDGFGIAAPTRSTEIEVNLDELDYKLQNLLEPGDYQWGLIGVEVVPEYKRIEMLSDGHQIRFNNYGLAQNPSEDQSSPASGE